MRLVHYFLLLSLLAFAAAGCVKPVKGIHETSPPPSSTMTDTTQATAEPYDPVTLGGDVFEEELLKEETPDEEASSEVTPEPEAVFGYRVQLGAFGDEANARTLEILANDEFDKPVYVLFEEPFWCVRLGDFRDMSDAETAKKTAISKGFTDARVIEDKIKTAD